jgi:hypothetical protein
MCRVFASRLSIYNFAGCHQKSIFGTSKKKKLKINVGYIRRKLQAQPKSKKKKKIETPNQPIEIKNISKKYI